MHFVHGQSYRVEPPSQPSRHGLRCVLIADDLTGACDAAIPFRLRGASVRVRLNPIGESPSQAFPVCDVLAFSTDSRALPVDQMESRLTSLSLSIDSVRFPDAVIFKKIDSTLRGNPGAEIAAALRAFHCDLALIAPAFPAMGRLVREGFLHSDRDPGWAPVHVAGLLHTQGLKNCHHVAPEAIQGAFAAGHRLLSLDTTVEEDLATIVAQAIGYQRRILWVGSAGLACALAHAIFPLAMSDSASIVRVPKPVVFAIGSNHPVTMEQVQALSQRYPVHRLHADSATAGHLRSALESSHHVILAVGRDTTSAQHLNTLLLGCSGLPAALLLSGGDTASLVCHAIWARAIQLEGEIVTGLPWGLLSGGPFDNLPVATKSGAFGSPHALIEVADFFSCLIP